MGKHQENDCERPANGLREWLSTGRNFSGFPTSRELSKKVGKKLIFAASPIEVRVWPRRSVRCPTRRECRLRARN